MNGFSDPKTFRDIRATGPSCFWVPAHSLSQMVTESDLDGDNDAEVTTAVGMLMKVLNLAMHDKILSHLIRLKEV